MPACDVAASPRSASMGLKSCCITDIAEPELLSTERCTGGEGRRVWVGGLGTLLSPNRRELRFGVFSWEKVCWLFMLGDRESDRGSGLTIVIALCSDDLRGKRGGRSPLSITGDSGKAVL